METWPVRRFKINRLHGYKDVEIRFVGSVLILVAGNGSGKTTILNALHSFLRGRFNKLWSLKFETIECDFSSSDETIVLSKDMASMKDVSLMERLRAITERTPYSEDDLYEFLSNSYQPNRTRGHPIVEALYHGTPYDMESLEEQLTQLQELVSMQSNTNLQEIWVKIQRATMGIEVVYLPTYRRIENPLLSPRMKRAKVRPALRRTSVDAPAVVDVSHMNYGLEDVEARLDELSSEVERTSNSEYRSASATIIDEALANAISPGSIGLGELPEFEPLARFLMRVSKADRHLFWEPSISEAAEINARNRIKLIQGLYESGRIADQDQWVLRYFLSRLGTVIEKTRETEAMLQRFVDACNSYLVESSDEKKFVYEPNSMRVTVFNSFTNSVVPLGQLSSGEKQIVSILAKLYLFHGQNLILIDEPELSLSIDWQRRIIPDMLRSGSVSQLLAITHSPFVFENELDPFAGPMHVVRHKVDA